MFAPTVLLADDDHELLGILTVRCEQLGVHVRTVDNSLDLLKAMHNNPPTVACIDVEMPHGSGLSVCELLASDPDLAKVPLILMTGRSDPDTIRRCWEICAYYVLKCPDVWPRLEPLLSELLASARPQSLTNS